MPATGDVPVPATGTDRTGTDPLARQDQATGQASPDAADHPATQPDMFGTTAHAGNGATSAPYPEDQVGEAANGAPAGGAPAVASRRVALRPVASRQVISPPVR